MCAQCSPSTLVPLVLHCTLNCFCLSFSPTVLQMEVPISKTSGVTNYFFLCRTFEMCIMQSTCKPRQLESRLLATECVGLFLALPKECFWYSCRHEVISQLQKYSSYVSAINVFFLSYGSVHQTYQTANGNTASPSVRANAEAGRGNAAEGH